MIPILILMDFTALVVIPAVLFSDFISRLPVAIFYHQAGNVTFNFKKDKEHKIVKKLGKLGYLPKSRTSAVALVLAGYFSLYLKSWGFEDMGD